MDAAHMHDYQDSLLIRRQILQLLNVALGAAHVYADERGTSELDKVYLCNRIRSRISTESTGLSTCKHPGASQRALTTPIRCPDVRRKSSRTIESLGLTHATCERISAGAGQRHGSGNPSATISRTILAATRLSTSAHPRIRRSISDLSRVCTTYRRGQKNSLSQRVTEICVLCACWRVIVCASQCTCDVDWNLRSFHVDCHQHVPNFDTFPRRLAFRQHIDHPELCHPAHSRLKTGVV